jgi:hypothetical protein
VVARAETRAVHGPFVRRVPSISVVPKAVWTTAIGNGPIANVCVLA